MNAASVICRTTVLLVTGLLVTACSNVPGITGGTSGLTSVTGSVIGYPYVGAATVQAFAPEDSSVQLLAGTLDSTPSPMVQASLTAVDRVPPSAFVNPFFCNAVGVSPPELRTTGIILAGVADSGGLFGLLVRATIATPLETVRVGDRLYFVLLASTAGRIAGSCIEDGTSYSYDISLSRGWNHVAMQFNQIDAFGNPIAASLFAATPSSAVPWYYEDLPTGLATQATSPLASALGTARRAFPGLQ